jgi:transcription termination factor Rho
MSGGGRRPGRPQRGRGPRRGGGGQRPPRRADLGLPDDAEFEGEFEGQMDGNQQRIELEEMDVGDLIKVAEETKIENADDMKRDELVNAILSRRAEDEGFLYRKGVLDVLPDGYGFLRTQGYLPSEEDVYVSMSQIRRFGLRRGDEVSGLIRPPKESEKYYALLRIENVNNLDPDAARKRPPFDKLTALFPDQRLRLEHEPKGFTERILDLVCPIGKGQRGMVVSPPKAGKTTILKQIANAIIENNPEVHVIVLLVDERPEEVTDWKRTVKAAEVVASTFDRPADDHIQITELVLERAKRLVEGGQDVAILCDSITRMARAYNLAAPASGKILSGGVDSTALYPPKRFFGAARNIEEGGSLTIIASCLVETGSRMDEVIFEEFKGTGNMEVRLDRTLAEKRLFPAINVEGSGTRKEELLMGEEELMLAWRLRRVLHALDPGQALELLIDKMKQTKSNAEFLKEIAKANPN